jgi:hypothetical protein
MKRRELLLTGPAAIAWMAVRPALPQQATGGRPRPDRLLVQHAAALGRIDELPSAEQGLPAHLVGTFSSRSS